MASFPNFSNIQGFVQSTLNSRKGNPELISKLNPFVRISSGAGAGLQLLSNPDIKLFRASGTVYGKATQAGTIGLTWGGNKADSPSPSTVNPTNGQGYKPSPVVTSLEIDEGAGSLSRKANFSITCFTKEQMEKVTQYFLEPGFSIFIEWGWNTSGGVGGLQPLGVKTISKFQSASARNTTRKNAGGEYDNYLGFITGGGVSADGDKWTISVSCTGYTELPTYLLTSETGEQKAGEDGTLNSAEAFGLNYIDTESTGPADERFMKMFNDLPQTRQTVAVKNLRGVFAADDSYLINFDDEVVESINDKTDGLTIAGFEVAQGKMSVDGKAIKFPTGTKITGEERFIRFDGLMKIIYEIGIDGYELPDGTLVSFQVDYEDTTCSAFPNIYSTDPSKLFIPNPKSPKFNLSAVPPKAGAKVSELISKGTIDNSVRNIQFPKQSGLSFKPVNGNTITKEAQYYGYLKDLYINFDFVKSVLDTKNFFIKDALYQILNGISSAVNGMWNFQLEESEVTVGKKSVNILKIWEHNLISSGKQKPTYTFNMVGEKSIFIDAGLDLDISGAKMNQIIAQKNSGKKVNSDSTKITLFQSGLTDNLGLKIRERNVDKTEKKTTTKKDDAQLAEANLNIMLGKARFYPRVDVTDSTSVNQDLYKLCYLGAFKDSNVFSALLSGAKEIGEADTASPLMPINFNFKIHGVSGIRRGDMFKVIGIPSIYNGGFFQVLSVKHTVEGMQWTTEVTGGYRNSK